MSVVTRCGVDVCVSRGLEIVEGVWIARLRARLENSKKESRIEDAHRVETSISTLDHLDVPHMSTLYNDEQLHHSRRRSRNIGDSTKYVPDMSLATSCRTEGGSSVMF